MIIKKNLSLPITFAECIRLKSLESSSPRKENEVSLLFLFHWIFSRHSLLKIRKFGGLFFQENTLFVFTISQKKSANESKGHEIFNLSLGFCKYSDLFACSSHMLNWVWQKLIVGNFMAIFYPFCNIMNLCHPVISCFHRGQIKYF